MCTNVAPLYTLLHVVVFQNRILSPSSNASMPAVNGTDLVLALCFAGFDSRRFFKEMRGNALDKKSNYELLE